MYREGANRVYREGANRVIRERHWIEVAAEQLMAVLQGWYSPSHHSSGYHDAEKQRQVRVCLAQAVS